MGIKGSLDLYELMTAPIQKVHQTNLASEFESKSVSTLFRFKVLDRWFESEPLKSTLATDGVVGAMVGPRTAGSG